MYKLTAIITQENKWYVARCVELGVVSQGKTIEDAQKNLKEAAALYLEDQPAEKRWFHKHAPLITTLELAHV